MALWEADDVRGASATNVGAATAEAATATATAATATAATAEAATATAEAAATTATATAEATAEAEAATATGTAHPPDSSRALTPELTEDDLGIDRSLRPRQLDDYIGQTRVKENLSVLIAAARQRKDVLDHLLFSGPPGLGKTTLSAVVANELGVSLKATSGPAIERAGDLAAILTNLEQGDVLFIDEIHRLNRTIEEVLYPAMEDFVLDIVIGKGPAAQSLRLDIPRFTLIGATTRTGLLTGPLRDRFGIAFRLDYYNEQELHDIVVRSATILDVAIDEGGAREIARRSRGTPRLANRLLRRVRDFAEVRVGHEITADVAKEALTFFEVDELGLDTMDNKILDVLVSTFNGKPVGLTTLANALGEDAESLEDVYEPYLLQQGLIQRTPKGRVATQRAFQHRGVPFDLFS
jgi:Holliday junction DNA helicase RuvB